MTNHCNFAVFTAACIYLRMWHVSPGKKVSAWPSGCHPSPAMH